MGAQHAAVEQQQSDQLARGLLIDQGGLADEVALVFQRQRPGETGFERGDGLVHVLAVEVHAGFEAQRVAAAKAARRDAGGMEAVPHRIRLLGGDGDLETVLSRIAGAGDQPVAVEGRLEGLQASLGLPLLNNFVGEYLVLQGAAQANFGWAVFAALGVILSACYLLWLYQRTFFGEVKSHLTDLTGREWAAILPLLVLMVWMGVASQTFLPPISAANARILEQTKHGVSIHVRSIAPASFEEAARAR